MMSFIWNLWRQAYSTRSAHLMTGRRACRGLMSSEPRRCTSMTAMMVARSEVCSLATNPLHIVYVTELYLPYQLGPCSSMVTGDLGNSGLVFSPLAGCGELLVTDGIWKLNYTVCLYRVPVEVRGMKLNFLTVVPISRYMGSHSVKSWCSTFRQQESLMTWWGSWGT